MKKITVHSLCVSLCMLCFTACHKDPVNPIIGPADSTSTSTSGSTSTPPGFKIGLSIGNNHELIISEVTGRVLLDTVAAPYTHISAALKTRSSLVDITVINPWYRAFYVTTFRAVNPASWTGAYLSNYKPVIPSVQPANPPVGFDTTLYENFNFAYYNIQEYQSGGIDESKTPSANTIRTIYQNLPQKYSYLCVADLGRYKLHLGKTTNDTVDCSTMDTTVYGNYNTSPYFAFTNTTIYGYTDSTDPASGLQLYTSDPGVGMPPIPQYQYPPKGIQKFITISNFFYSTRTSYMTYYNCSSNVSHTVVYPDLNAGPTTLGAGSNDLEINLDNTKPTYYSTVWTAPNFFWTLYSSPDSTTLHPLSLLTVQNAKLLEGFDLALMGLNQFQFETVDTFSYQSFLSMACDSLKASKGITNSVSFFRVTN